MRNNIFITCGILIALGLIWFKLTSNQQKADNEIQAEKEVIPFAVETATVRESEFSQDISYPGTIETGGTVNLSSETEGKVIKAFIQNGAKIQKGQVIALLDNQAKVAAHQVNEINYNKAKVDYDRLIELHSHNNATGQEVENAHHAMLTAEKQLFLSQSELSKAKIVSPISGVVSSKSINTGDYVSAGSPLAVLVSLTDLQVRTYVPEREIAKVREGQKVYFSADAYPGNKFDGIVTAIIPSANQAKAFPVMIKVRSSQDGVNLMGGMTVNVRLQGLEKSKALVIPRTAVRGDFNSPYVWAVGEGKKAIKRQFQMGRQLDDRIEVISGLNSGDLIVAKGQSNITEGIVLHHISDSKSTSEN